MIVELTLLLGKVTFDSQKVPGDFNLNTIPERKERDKLQAQFFPLGEGDLQHIEFEPANEKFDTQAHKDSLLKYLKDECFIKPDGNFSIEVATTLVLV